MIHLKDFALPSSSILEETNHITKYNPFGDPHQVIILGNGFDLQCGLESSYK